jgi:hypothetical protein
VIALFVLTVVPLAVSVFCFGHRSWTSQWSEIAVALGWSTPSYPWVDDIPQIRFTESAPTPLDWEQFSLSLSDDAATRAARVHGLWLVLRERSMPFGHDPMNLIWSTQLSERGRQLLVQGRNMERFGSQLRSAFSDAPHDSVIQAELLCGSEANRWLAADAQQRISLTQSAADGSTVDRVASDLWRALANAARVLREHSGATYPNVYVGWIPRGNVSTMYAHLGISDGSPFEKWGSEEYARAIEQLNQVHTEEYLEKPLEDRAQWAWELLGLEPEIARYAAQNDSSISALAAGEHVAQHLELLQKLAEHAIGNNDLDRAARWIELSESAASVFERSVHSVWIRNYIRKQLGTTGSLAQVVRGLPACSPEVAERMAAIVARNKVPVVLAITPHDEPFIAFCLDNLSRSCLKIAAWTLVAAAIGVICLRVRDKQPYSFFLRNAAGSKLIAGAAVLVVTVVFVGLESANALGERVSSSLYAFTFVTILSILNARIGWLITVEIVRDPDPQRQTLRRRIAWLIGCGIMFVAMRPIVGGRNLQFDPNALLAGLEPPTRDAGLSAALRLFFGSLLGVTALAYAVLGWRRSRSESMAPAIPPIVIGAVAVWLSLWLVIGPPGTWLRGQKSWFPSFGNDWSAALEAADHVSFILELPTTANPTYHRGWNLLTFGVALRMTNAGLWLVLACLVLWLVVVYRPCYTRMVGFDCTTQSRTEMDSRWLIGITWSCVWLSLVSLLIHAWATLGMAYVINSVLTSNA